MFSESEMGIILKALEFAADKHKQQRRKGLQNRPYINHPIRLASLLINDGKINDVSILAAAILHDTIEDTDTTKKELLIHFGKTIADYVEEVTDDPHLSKMGQRDRQLEITPTLSTGAKLIRLADKISNVEDLYKDPPQWRSTSKAGYLGSCKKVVNALRGVNPELERIFNMVHNEAMIHINNS
jgi:guanosine-3',5'-bis(diphosphate) 3'-pyrophosphohydrolase